MVQEKNSSTIYLDGSSLTVDTLVTLSKGQHKLDLTPEAWKKVEEGRLVVDNILKEKQIAYGINTGFGLFSQVVVSPEHLNELQENLIRSHCAGVGNPLSPNRTRMLLALRTNVLAKGHSGIRVSTVKKLLDAFNCDCLSIVPEKGTVGASGDLAPLSHLALGLLGEGKMWNTSNNTIENAADVLAKHNLQPVQLEAKEGLALINGTQLIAALGAEAVVRAENAAKCADIAISLTLEVLKGTVNAFHPRIHQVRPHKGQNLVASRIRTLLCADSPSELFRSHNYAGKVQDPYTLRCAPQVHGIVNDTIDFVRSLLEVELNSATDNPMIFTGNDNVTTDCGLNKYGSKKNQQQQQHLEKEEDNNDIDIEPHDLTSAKLEIERLRKKLKSNRVESTGLKNISDTFYRGGGGFVISGGNFHGEYPAKALDYLAIGVHELASISERRIERLVNPNLSGLPAFLVENGGLNSGFMIAHCTAAALVSENKVLCHPSSVDSISTSGSKEDHVSMGGFSARKALKVVEHVEQVLAIEILAACQALDLLRPLKTTGPLENVYKLVRSKVPPLKMDRTMSPDIEAVAQLIQSGQIYGAVQSYLEDNHPSSHTIF